MLTELELLCFCKVFETQKEFDLGFSFLLDLDVVSRVGGCFFEWLLPTVVVWLGSVSLHTLIKVFFGTYCMSYV